MRLATTIAGSPTSRWPRRGTDGAGGFFACPNAALQGRGDGIGGAAECVSGVFAKGANFRQIGSGHEDRSVVVGRELNGIAQHLLGLLESRVLEDL